MIPLGSGNTEVEIAEVKIPQVKIPVKTGRNVAIIIEEFLLLRFLLLYFRCLSGHIFYLWTSFLGKRLIEQALIPEQDELTLVGEPPRILQHLIEIRGIGIIDVMNLFGASAVRGS
jgi:serine kinase of HPr protein (carbohydrate metabolism regulator)